MSLTNLLHLVAAARALANDHPCGTGGHLWKMDGGRQCPEGHDGPCYQPVFVCARCGEIDYGQSGGPGRAICDHGKRHSAPCSSQ